MSIISGISQAIKWLGKVFVSHTVSAAPVAVTITEFIKTLLANPVVGFLENTADAVTGTQVPTEIANDINALIPKILAVELSIEGLPTPATEAQVLTFERAILGAFNVTSNNSKLYTELASQIYGRIQANITSGQTNFADWVTAIEQSYTDYQKDLAANAVVVSTTVVTTPPAAPIEPETAPIAATA